LEVVKMYAVAVVGGGVAGLSCALTLADGIRRFDFAKVEKFCWLILVSLTL